MEANIDTLMVDLERKVARRLRLFGHYLALSADKSSARGRVLGSGEEHRFAGEEQRFAAPSILAICSFLLGFALEQYFVGYFREKGRQRARGSSFSFDEHEIELLRKEMKDVREIRDEVKNLVKELRLLPSSEPFSLDKEELMKILIRCGLTETRAGEASDLLLPELESAVKSLILSKSE